MAGEKVLIIDDDRNSVRFLQLELEHEGYLVEKEYDGLRGLKHATQEQFDIILLDIMLPGMNGMGVLQEFRRISDTPVIMLTAKDAVSDKVLGLDGGADDYLTKPFAIEELLARMRAALKKHGVRPSGRRDIITIGKLLVNRSAREVSYEGRPIQLTKREFDLLCYLMENHDIVCSRDKLMDKV